MRCLVIAGKSFVSAGTFQRKFHSNVPVKLKCLTISFSLNVSTGRTNLAPLRKFIADFLRGTSTNRCVTFALVNTNTACVRLYLVAVVTGTHCLLVDYTVDRQFSPSAPVVRQFLITFSLASRLFNVTVKHPKCLGPCCDCNTFLITLPN